MHAGGYLYSREKLRARCACASSWRLVLWYRRGSSMRRARSVTGPLRRAHPASGATWNVQVVRGKMSSQCLWHACRALSAGLLLMLLGAAMAVIGYYADFLSVDQEIRGNATVSVKDEARGFHLNNLSYVGPIVMGFGGFIVVAACVMTFEARDSAAKVTPARPTALPRPLPRRGPPCAPARLDQLGVYRLPHVLPLPHSLPLVPMHRHRPVTVRNTEERVKGRARFGSAPDLRSGSGRATRPVAALRRPLRRYALSVDEPPQSAVSASAAESECGSQSSLALDLHASGACTGVTLRVRDNTRRRPLARQQRLRDDTLLPTPRGSTANINNAEETAKTSAEESNTTIDATRLSVEDELRASSAPPSTRPTSLPSPLLSPTVTVITPPRPEHTDTCITIDLTEQLGGKLSKQQMERQTDALKGTIDEEIAILPREVVIDLDIEELVALHENRDRIVEEEMERQIELQIMVAMAEEEDIQTDNEDGTIEDNEDGQESADVRNTADEEDNARALDRRFSEVVEVTGYPSLFDLNTRNEFTLERLQEELEIDVVSRLAFRYECHTNSNINNIHTEQKTEQQFEEAIERQHVEVTEKQFEEAMQRRYEEASEKRFEEATEIQFEEALRTKYAELTERQYKEVTEKQFEEATAKQSEEVAAAQYEEATEKKSKEVTNMQSEEMAESQTESVIQPRNPPPDV